MRRAARWAPPEACAGALRWAPHATSGSPSRGGCAAPSDPRPRRLLSARPAGGEPPQRRKRIERPSRRALAAAHLEVEMVAPAGARAPHRADPLRRPNALADPYAGGVQHVQVDERAAHLATPDRDVVPAAAVVAGLHDATVAHRNERGAGGGEHVLPLVHVVATECAEASVLLAEVDASADGEHDRRPGRVPEARAHCK